MKKFVYSLAALAASVAIAPAVSAAPTISIDTGSGTFGNNHVVCTAPATAPCTFSDTIQFTTPAGYTLTSATISSAMAGADMTTNIDFTSVTLNGVQFTTLASGLVEFRSLLSQTIVAGATNTLVISGTTGGNGAYGGSLTFSTAAVPEPAAWALMILGFGVVGYALRRRPAARFAQAF